MHLQSLLEPRLDPPDVAPILQRISFECEKAGLIAVPQQANAPLREDPSLR